MDESIAKLKEAIRNKKVLLFVGSGISCSVGLPSWSELITKLADQLGIDKDLYEMLGDNLSLAEYYEICQSELDPAVIPAQFICDYIKGKEAEQKDRITSARVLQQIVNLDCPIIYTTNYDHCLELAHAKQKKMCKAICDVKNMASVCERDTQIIKFHGDYDHPQSIVFSESSYFDRLDFESPLDIKLRADMLGRSILFIGYSLSDINIRLLTYKLDKLWKKNEALYGISKDERPDSYIFMAKPNYIQEKIFESRKIIPIVGNSIDCNKSTSDFLKIINPKLCN